MFAQGPHTLPATQDASMSRDQSSPVSPAVTGTMAASGTNLIQAATAAAWVVVRKNLSERGIAASIEGYPQVWMRDTVITCLGAVSDRQPEMIDVLRCSLASLAAGQDRFGQLPFLIHIADGRTEFGSSDANPWFAIGCAVLLDASGDAEWYRQHMDRIVLALDWCESRDVQRCGLMESGECADWADLLSHHGKVLFPNVLYAHALRVTAERFATLGHPATARLQARHQLVREALRQAFWVAPFGTTVDDQTHHRVRQLANITLRARRYFLPWIGTFDFGDRLDVAGNLLAILSGVADPSQANAILDYIDGVGLNRPYPVQVYYPAIRPGDADWRDYYKIWDANTPHHYHNGGIWPWVGGAYIAALVRMGRRSEAEAHLARLAEAVMQGSQPGEFNEWLHGQSGRPMGARFQAWSAGMFIYARHAFDHGDCIGFPAIP